MNYNQLLNKYFTLVNNKYFEGKGKLITYKGGPCIQLNLESEGRKFTIKVPIELHRAIDGVLFQIPSKTIYYSGCSPEFAQAFRKNVIGKIPRKEMETYSFKDENGLISDSARKQLINESINTKPDEDGNYSQEALDKFLNELTNYYKTQLLGLQLRTPLKKIFLPQQSRQIESTQPQVLQTVEVKPSTSKQEIKQLTTIQTSKKPVETKQSWNWTWDGDDDVEVGNLKFTGLKGLQLNDSQVEQLRSALEGLGYNTKNPSKSGGNYTDNLSESLKQYLQNKKNSLSYTSSLKPQESKPIEDYYDDRLKGGLLNLYSYISGNLNRGATWRLGKNDYNDIINSDWYNLLDDDSKEYFTRDKLNNQLGDRYFRSYLIGMNNNLNHEEN